MLILSLDTTTPAGSHAVAESARVLCERLSATVTNQAARLPKELMDTLQQARIRLEAVDLFAVAVGPGAFTGLRIGIATMQGLSLAVGRPLIGISALDALATVTGPAAPDSGLVATWVDAWRGEVYAALYENGREVESPIVTDPETLLSSVKGRPMLFAGSGAATYADVIRRAMGTHALLAEPTSPPLAGAVATLAYARARAGDRPLPHAIQPLYVRRPDAELARDARREGGVR